MTLVKVEALIKLSYTIYHLPLACAVFEILDSVCLWVDMFSLFAQKWL